MKSGDVVQIHHWYGVAPETHFDERGTPPVIRVQTARDVFRGYGPEYIDVRMDPEAVKPASRAGLEREIQTHRRLLDGAAARLLDESRHSQAVPTAD